MPELKPITNAVKSLGADRIGGYLVAFGSPNDADLDGEYFTKDTNFELDWYGERPVLYGHGMDKSHKTSAIGTIDKIEVRDEAGLWAEAQLRDHFMYRDYVMKWLEEGKLGWSSGSSPYYAKVNDDGFIRTWPIHEGSLTLNPAQPGKTTVRSVKHVTNVEYLHKAVKELGLQDYNMDELMLHYEHDVALKESQEDETETGEAITAELVESRPINITNKIYVTSDLLDAKAEGDNSKESTNKDITMDSNVKNKEAVENQVEETQEVEESVETTSATASASATEAQQVTTVVETVQPEPIKEVSDEYFIKKARERMLIFEVPVVQANLEDSAAKAKAWIRAKTFSPVVTEDIAEFASTNDEFQKFYNELIKSYMPSEDTSNTADSDPEVAALKAQVAQLTQLIGTGGKSVLPNSDNQQGSSTVSTKYDNFYFVEDASEKANYANYGFEDLAMYGYLRDYATRKGFADRPWRVNEQDAFYNALFHAGKDIVPQIADLIPNPHWHDNDVAGEEIFAVKAFRHMGVAFKGKAIKANEVVSTGLDGRGAEWIYTLPDGTLWNILLSEVGVMNAIPSFNMTAGSVDMYIDDETGYASLVPEIVNAGADATSRQDAANSLGNYAVTPAGSQKVNFKARHIGQQTVLSKIELEDGRIDVARTARMQLEHALRRSIDWAIINAHNPSTATENFGWYGQAAGGTNAGLQGLAGIGFDGLIARALTQSSDANNAGYQVGGGLCVDVLTATRRLMDQRYYGNHSMIRMIMTPADCDMLWDLEEFKRAAQYSGSWDGGAGMITSFQGTPIIKSEEVVKRNSAGQHSMTAADNTRGVVVMFRPDRTKLGIRRRLSRSMSEVGPYGEHLRIGASIRFDFQTIPNAVANTSGGQEYGSGLIRKPVSVAYDLV